MTRFAGPLMRRLAVALRRGRVHLYTGRLTPAGTVPATARFDCGRRAPRGRVRPISDVDAALNGFCRRCRATGPLGKPRYLDCADPTHLLAAIRYAPDDATLDRLIVVLCDRGIVNKPIGTVPGTWTQAVSRRRYQLHPPGRRRHALAPIPREPRPTWWAGKRTPAQQLRADLATSAGDLA